MSRQRPFPATLLVAVLVLASLTADAPPLEWPAAGTGTVGGRHSSPPSAYVLPTPAVEALRAGECDRARAAIKPTTAAARTVAALYAHACGAHADALRLLHTTEDDRGPLADWRRWTQGESAAELGYLETAQDAFSALATEYPSSPLAGPATFAAAELALERGDLTAVDRLVAAAREGEIGKDGGARLAVVAWKAASTRADPVALRRSARRLLTDHPVTAAELGVIEVFRAPDGTLDWTAMLDPAELQRRARRLLAADLAPSAVETLDRVPEPARDRDWLLLRAEALTAANRGLEALETLTGLTAVTPAMEAKIVWRRARAALEASIARRGRTTSAADRRERRQEAHRHLRRVVILAADAELTRRALRALFADLAELGRFDEALEALHALREIDPGDETGAVHLWRWGWNELERRDPTSAIGYWAELRRLYPDSTAARRALYWSARAHQDLGNHERSQDLLRQVVASPHADFYHRHAMERLDAPAVAVDAPRTPTAWPLDPNLRRARWLSDIGLDRAALLELELVGGRAEPRAVDALEAEILARQGETRRSIIELRRAFPDLGTHRQHRAPEQALRLYYPLEFDGLVTAAARRHDLPPHLVFAMIRQESAFDSRAHSHAGAKGLMQVMPATGRELAGRLGLSYTRARLVEPEFSVQLGTAYFWQVLRSFGDEELALAGYNGGPNRIRRWWNRSGDWDEVDRFIEGLPLDETRTYVQRIVLLSNAYRDLYAG